MHWKAWVNVTGWISREIWTGYFTAKRYTGRLNTCESTDDTGKTQRKETENRPLYNSLLTKEAVKETV